MNQDADVGEGRSTPLFANHVVSGGGTPAEWNIEVLSGNSTYSGVIGKIDSGTVNLTFTNNSGADVVANADGTDPEYEVAHVGAVCGKIDKDATLNLTFTESSSSYSITTIHNLRTDRIVTKIQY